ncbi:type IV pilus twitching motility protein PilT [Naasia sp.]|uniref:type IV pilus twitching motility protein PilT n=1 Tax=Naasia sp. TaxID=2546198 RepID=UPI00261D05A1|nr:type IV pilus twitching motility protein PilT [Naasia sp.]
MDDSMQTGGRPRSHTVWDVGVEDTPVGADYVGNRPGETRGRRAAVVDDATLVAAVAAAESEPEDDDLVEDLTDRLNAVAAPPVPESRFDVARGPEAALQAALREVVSRGASDLHLGADAAPKVRVDGALISLPDAPVWSGSEVGAVLRSIMTEAQRLRFGTELELDFAYSLSTEYRFRVNVYQQRDSMGAAFRLIPTEIRTLGDLGIPDAVARFAQLPRGLVLVTGPTGSGKSTTLAALIDLANRTRSDHIMTVEDPIEFLHTNKKSLVNQREVGADTHSFSAALKHVLRQDPDIILIGELRDLETISVALTAAETGHLVFATLHTQDAPQTIDRIIDVFPPAQQGQVRAQLAGTLQGVVSQILVRRASGAGRAVATEVLVTTPAVANLIREGKTFQISSSMQAGRDLGMHTLDQRLAELVTAGVITRQAAAEKAHDLEGLSRILGRSGAGMGDLDLGYETTERRVELTSEGRG